MKIMGITSRGLIVVAVSCMSVSARAQTPEFHYLHGGQYEGVVFLDADKGWISGDGGRIRYTTNGGTDWLTADLDEEPGVPVRVQMRGMHFLSEDQGWAVGDGGVILRSKSSPSGSTEWEDINSSNRITNQVGSGQDPCVLSDELATLYGSFMIDELEGWVVGTDGVLCKTTDGWETWEPISGLGGFECGEDPSDSYDIHFFLADSSVGQGYTPYSKGIIASEYGRVFTTDDGGSTWDEVNIYEEMTLEGDVCPGPHNNIELWELSFEDPTDASSAGWVSAGVDTNRGYILHTSSGGTTGTWTQSRCYDFLDPVQFDVICGTSTQYACAVLDSESSPVRVMTGGYGGALLVYEVGDTNYDPCNCSYDEEIGETFDPDCGFDEATFVQKDNLVPEDINPLGHRPPLLAAARMSDTQGCVVGDFGRVTLYETGADPEVTEPGTRYSARLLDAEFLSATTGCAVGQGQTVYLTTNGGVDWAVAEMDWNDIDGNYAKAIDFSSSGDFGVIVGTGAFFARTTEDGQNPSDAEVVAGWTRVEVTGWGHNPPSINAVAFVPGEETVYAVTETGRVVRSTDNGEAWTLLTAYPTSSELHGVSFVHTSGNDVGYVVGDGASVYKTTNGGSSWSAVQVTGGNSEAFRDVETWGDGTEAILVADNGGVYVKTSTRFVKLDADDFGFDEPTAHLYDVEVLSSGTTVRIGGDNGLALFRDSGTWSQPRTSVGKPLYKMAFQSADHGFGIGLTFLVVEYLD